MKVVVNLPEAEVERLGGVDAAARGLAARLKALPHYNTQDRLIVLSGNDRAAVEGLIGQPLETPTDLINAFMRLAYIDLGGIKRHLTPGEAARVKAYADAHGLSTQVAAEQLLNPLIDEWLRAV